MDRDTRTVLRFQEKHPDHYTGIEQIVRRCSKEMDSQVQKDISYLIMLVRQRDYVIRNLERQLYTVSQEGRISISDSEEEK